MGGSRTHTIGSRQHDPSHPRRTPVSPPSHPRVCITPHSPPRVGHAHPALGSAGCGESAVTIRPRLRRIGPPPRRQVRLGARVAVLRSAMVRGNSARAALYASSRWRRERRAFLKNNPVCVTTACGQRAVIVDHRDGHQGDWASRFWDQRTWQPMCTTCHAVKSRAELHAWRQAGEGGVGKSQ